MTSSFSTMLLFTHQLIAKALHQTGQSLAPVAAVAEQWCQELLLHPAVEAATQSQRLVYLGSNNLYGAAQESALKALEMTGGKIVTLAETPLGFRHGPKSIINDKTTVCLFISTDTYTQQFDCDMVIELLNDECCQQVLVIAPNDIVQQLLSNAPNSQNLQMITLPQVLNDYTDALLAPLYVLVSQIIGLRLALTYNISPDNPCPTGEVNRVVQGVTLYELK